jgi:Uma2 family endonuclease
LQLKITHHVRALYTQLAVVWMSALSITAYGRTQGKWPPLHGELQGPCRPADAQAFKSGAGSVYYAPIDVLLAPTTIVQPDLVFVAATRQAIVTERAIEGAPDLVVEILSPSTSRQDRVTKAALYARFGVPFYWIVDPSARTLEEYALAQDSYRLVAVHSGPTVARTELFPDLEIDLAQVWP